MKDLEETDKRQEKQTRHSEAQNSKLAAKLSIQYHPSLTSYADSWERALKTKDKSVAPFPPYFA